MRCLTVSGGSGTRQGSLRHCERGCTQFWSLARSFPSKRWCETTRHNTLRSFTEVGLRCAREAHVRGLRPGALRWAEGAVVPEGVDIAGVRQEILDLQREVAVAAGRISALESIKPSCVMHASTSARLHLWILTHCIRPRADDGGRLPTGRGKARMACASRWSVSARMARAGRRIPCMRFYWPNCERRLPRQLQGVVGGPGRSGPPWMRSRSNSTCGA